MSRGEICFDKCTTYHEETFPQGITNGAEWYSLYGGMQDWVYENTNTMDITLELGCYQYPPAESLPTYWEQNKRALLSYIRAVHRGIKGLVSDAFTGALLANVTVYVVDRPHNVTTSKFGDFFRILKAGYYEIGFAKEGYESQQMFVTIQNSMPIIANIRLKPIGGQALMPVSSEIVAVSQSNDPHSQYGAESSKLVSQVESNEHSLMVATLVMTIIILLILISVIGLYMFHKGRFIRTQSMEMHQTRSAGTGISLPGQISSGSSINPSLSP